MLLGQIFEMDAANFLLVTLLEVCFGKKFQFRIRLDLCSFSRNVLQSRKKCTWSNNCEKRQKEGVFTFDLLDGSFQQQQKIPKN